MMRADPCILIECQQLLHSVQLSLDFLKISFDGDIHLVNRHVMYVYVYVYVYNK